MNKKGILVLFLASITLFWIFTGFFVIQPIGAIPDGATVWYYRFGTKFSFISSPDGFLLDNGQGVSILGRAIVLGKMGEIIKEKKLFPFPTAKLSTYYQQGGKNLRNKLTWKILTVLSESER